MSLSDELLETPALPVEMSEPEFAFSDLPNSEVPASAVTPQVIDLASSLGMAGGNAWMIQLARQRTVEAHADVTSAKALWLPSLQFGVGWNNHGGRIQATDGQVIEAARSSLFFGGGATLGDAPIAGGSGGPLRLTADLALADAFFAQQIAGRTLAARRCGVSVAQNQAVVRAGLAYVDLLEAAAMRADAQAAIDAASELLQLTRTFQEAGAGAQADVDRAATEQARLQQHLQDADRRIRTSSATLARQLRLDARTMLIPADPTIMPLELSSYVCDLDSLVGIALSRRPELSEQSQQIAALSLEVQKADIEPWIPHLAMTTSAGTFGGGPSSAINNSGSRSDVDLQALWELDSLGVGVRAKRERASSRLAQGRTQLADLNDEISAQVVRAYENVTNYRSQIETANRALELAETSYQRNLARIRAVEGLPIELLQAITARAVSLSQRTTAVAAYNRAQLELLYATGQLSP
jgi:outer membrane protein TolC